jgi:hypothetical protein
MGLHLDAENVAAKVEEGDNDDRVEIADEAIRTAIFWGAFSLD